jgi:hypothetical protein
MVMTTNKFQTEILNPSGSEEGLPSEYRVIVKGGSLRQNKTRLVAFSVSLAFPNRLTPKLAIGNCNATRVADGWEIDGDSQMKIYRMVVKFFQRAGWADPDKITSDIIKQTHSLLDSSMK